MDATFGWTIDGAKVDGESGNFIASGVSGACSQVRCEVMTVDGQPAHQNTSQGRKPPNASCDDGNDCTVAVCGDAGGCEQKPEDGKCDDGDPCTDAGDCKDGECATGPEITCDDGIL